MPKPDPMRAKEVFDEAADVPPGERTEFLDRACGGNDELRAEVESLLQAMHAGASFLGGATHDGARGGPQPEETPGTDIGRYRLVERIGEGGFGAVYLAQQTEPVARPVALKIIKLGMDTRQVVARFEAERQALALMDHPGIARVLDGGATATGRPYFVMELVKGEPITAYCDANRLGPRERLDLFVQVCHAVQHAHTKGIIHRDIKPSNVLVTMIDGRPVPKVIDFGIAKAISGRLTEKTLFTEFRQFVGTPEYMSPEQAALSGVDIDTRSDVYSLGVLLYELLTGAAPFDARRLRSAAFDEMMWIIREEEPLKPSTRLSGMKEAIASVAARRRTEPGRLTKLIRGDLDWIVMRCLEKDRARRYETANGLAGDIDRHLRGEPVHAAPPSNVYRLRKFVRRNRVGVLASGAVGLVLLLGVIGTSIGLVHARASAAELRRRTERALAVSGFLSGLADSGGLHAGAMDSARLLDEAVARGAPIYFDGGEGEADVRLAVGVNYFRLGHPRDAEAHLRRAWQIRTARLGPEALETLACSAELARQLARCDRTEEAEPMARHAVASLERRFGLRNAATLDAYDALAAVLRHGHGYDELAGFCEHVVPAQREVLGRFHPTTRRTTYAFARAVMEQTSSPERVRLAEGWSQEVLDAYDSGALPFDGLEPEYRDMPWRLLVRDKRWREAEVLTRVWLEHIERHGGDAYVGAPRLLLHRGVALRALYRDEEAEATLRKALELAERYAGTMFFEATTIRIYLAQLLNDRGKLEDAEGFIRATHELLRTSLGPENRKTIAMVHILAVNLDAQGRLDEAGHAAREALEGYRRFAPSFAWEIEQMLDVLGRTCFAQGLPEEALSYFEQLTYSHPNYSRLPHITIATHAACLRRLGRMADAERLLVEFHARATARGADVPFAVRALAEELVALYDEWGKAAQAEEWRARLAALRGPSP